MTAVVITCEHGGNNVPQPYRKLMAGSAAVLKTHRGWDPGALPLARIMAKTLDAPLIASETTRLLVDLNRSIGHPRHFSEFSRLADPSERERIIRSFYAPYRRQVESSIAKILERHRSAVHISVHTFTPVLDGKRRRADIGLLYDPHRPLEVRLCHEWKRAIEGMQPHLVVMRNSPYRGTSDGLTAHLRKEMGSQYVGIELEVNQRISTGPERTRQAVFQSLAHSLRESLNRLEKY